MTTYKFVPTEEVDEEWDDGTIVNNVATVAQEVVGHRIVKVEKREQDRGYWYRDKAEVLAITLDNGKTVTLGDTNDCCAYTELDSFIFNADKIDHIITGVSTEGEYTKWHIFADAGDVLELSVGWSSGNPFYYGYGFEIEVVDDGS